MFLMSLRYLNNNAIKKPPHLAIKKKHPFCTTSVKSAINIVFNTLNITGTYVPI